MTTSLNLALGEESRKRIDRLFLRFAAIYGQVWRSQFKNDEYLGFVKSEWEQGLLGYEEKVLDMAIDMCRNHKELPPTLPQFIDFCKACSKRNTSSLPKAPQISSNPEVAISHLKKIKTILNM